MELFYVHTNYADSLYKLEKQNQVLFSTSPLGKEQWEPVLFTTLQAYRDGELLYQGNESWK